jgi:hypothetical protein
VFGGIPRCIASRQAARADALARALRKAESTRDSLQRLKVGGVGLCVGLRVSRCSAALLS